VQCNIIGQQRLCEPAPAWATPVVHDTRAGLRFNARCGFSMHGLTRDICQGFIAGRNAVTENDNA
jgi:hypothetical protein